LSEQNKGLAKTALLITLISAGSKVLGFVREMVIAFVYGAGAITDAFAIAVGVVTTANLLVSTYLTTTFVPAYARIRAHQGNNASNRFTNTNLWLAILTNTALLIMLQATAPFVSRWIAPGFGADQTLVVVSAMRISLFQLPFLAAIALFSGFLTARKSFYGPNLIGVPLSVVVSAICLILGRRRGVEGLTIASLFGVVSQLLILLFWLTREKYRVTLSFRIMPEVKEGVSLLLPALIGSAVIELNQWVDKVLASGLPEGSVASINFATRLIGLVQGLLIIPIAGIVFSIISEHAAKKETKEMLDAFWHWVRVVLFFVIPIVAIAIPTSSDIVRIVYERGAFGADATRATSAAFVWYLPSLLSAVFYVFLIRFYYALRDTKTPMFCGAFAIAVNIVLSIVMVRAMGIAGLALSTSVGSMLSAFLLLICLRRKIGPIAFFSTLTSILKMMLCAGVCLLCVLGVMHFLSEHGLLFRFAVCTLAGGSVYFALTLVFKVPVAHEALQYVKSKILEQ